MRQALEVIQLENGVSAEEVNLYLCTREFAPGDSLSVAGKARVIPIQKTALLVFADLKPLANWGHPTRNLFFDKDDNSLVYGDYDQFPPDGFETEQNAFEPLHVPLVYTEPPHPSPDPEMGKRFYLPQLSVVPPLGNAAGRRHAILFSGNSNNRHLNDLEFLYRVLVGMYGYEPANIMVLNYDGSLNYNGPPQPVTTWPGDHTPYRLHGHINGPGTRAAFEAAFRTVAGKIRPEDSLLIHTNNHGGGTTPYGEPWLCGYPNFSLVFKASEFGAAVGHPAAVRFADCFHGAVFLRRILKPHDRPFDRGGNQLCLGGPGEHELDGRSALRPLGPGLDRRVSGLQRRRHSAETAGGSSARHEAGLRLLARRACPRRLSGLLGPAEWLRASPGPLSGTLDSANVLNMAFPRTEILSIVKDSLAADKSPQRKVFVDKRAKAAGDVVRTGLATTQMPFAGYVAFVDLAPDANWGHPVVYLLVDLANRNAVRVDEQFPPPDEELRDDYDEVDLVGP